VRPWGGALWRIFRAHQVFLEKLEVFFEAVAFVHVRFARVLILELFFVFETK